MTSSVRKPAITGLQQCIDPLLHKVVERRLDFTNGADEEDFDFSFERGRGSLNLCDRFMAGKRTVALRAATPLRRPAA
jgi:hypothetical protein